MPNGKIQSDYEYLESATGLFRQEAEQTSSLHRSVSTLVNQLRNGDWVGVGAQAFYAELDGEVLPAMNRLSSALQDASQAAAKVAQAFHDAEDEAGRLFQGDSNGGNGRGGGSGGSGSGALGSLGSLLSGLLGNARLAVKTEPIVFDTPPKGSLGEKLAKAGFKQDGPTCQSTTEFILLRAMGYPDLNLSNLTEWEKFRASLDPGYVLNKWGYNTESYSQARWVGKQDPDAARNWLADKLANNKGVIIGVESDLYDPQHYGKGGKADIWPVDGHALIVTGVVRDSSGKITHYQVIDPNFADKGAANGKVIRVAAAQLENAWADRGFQAIATEESVDLK